MTDQEETALTFLDFLSNLYDDPIRPETAKRGRWLIGVSIATTSVTVFGANLSSTSSFPINFPATNSALPSVLALLVVLLLGEFILRSTTDLLREKEIQLVINKYISAQSLHRKKLEAKAVDDQQEDPREVGYDWEPDPWWRQFYMEADAAKERIEKLEERLGERWLPRTLRNVRMTLELSAPVLLGLVAISVSQSHIIEFSSATLRLLIN